MDELINPKVRSKQINPKQLICQYQNHSTSFTLCQLSNFELQTWFWSNIFASPSICRLIETTPHESAFRARMAPFSSVYFIFTNNATAKDSTSDYLSRCLYTKHQLSLNGGKAPLSKQQYRTRRRKKSVNTPSVGGKIFNFNTLPTPWYRLITDRSMKATKRRKLNFPWFFLHLARGGLVSSNRGKTCQGSAQTLSVSSNIVVKMEAVDRFDWARTGAGFCVDEKNVEHEIVIKSNR